MAFFEKVSSATNKIGKKDWIKKIGQMSVRKILYVLHTCREYTVRNALVHTMLEIYLLNNLNNIIHKNKKILVT